MPRDYDLDGTPEGVFGAELRFYRTQAGLSQAELAALWRKATYSTGNGGNCVEVASNLPGIVAVRDSKDPDGPALAFSPEDWRAFTASVKAGRFSLA